MSEEKISFLTLRTSFFLDAFSGYHFAAMGGTKTTLRLSLSSYSK